MKLRWKVKCQISHDPVAHIPELIAELKRWFGLSGGSAGQRSLVTLLAGADFNASRWLVRKLMKQAGLVNRQQPTHRYAKRLLKNYTPHLSPSS